MKKRQDRIIRDPIHGDIRIRPIAAAIIDTTAFQRLRYIRQNGLLHFIFPGAVHTRFAHSIGTLAVAARVFPNLFPSAPSDNYARIVFELAALLHDVGHCAFSHSIEHVQIGGHPFFHTMRDIAKKWSDPDVTTFTNNYVVRHPDSEKSAVSHEQLGLLFLRKIFQDARVIEACDQELKTSATNVADDVSSILDNHLVPSEKFVSEADSLGGTITIGGPVSGNDVAAQVQAVLHDLISGTLDVDRLDYLVRDSFYTGAPYGRCDVEVLVNALRIANIGGRCALVLKERAAYALDDMLWSRYQLFLQVLNHKTNVALNAMLKDALPEAIQSFAIGLKQPLDYEDFIVFTDDLVMSAVFSVCNNPAHRNTTYARALVHRDLPLHLGAEDLKLGEGEQRIAQLRQEKARKISADPTFERKIISWEARSDLVKAGPLPLIMMVGKTDHVPHYQAFWDRSIISELVVKKLPCVHQRVHFFVDRREVKGV